MYRDGDRFRDCFMPVQIGIKGIWVFIAATLLSYPAIYWLQNLYLRTLSESEECEDYASVITQYLGKNWGLPLVSPTS